MNYIETCGKIAAGLSAMVVLVAIGMLVLMIACMCLGAYAQITNPDIGNQTQQEYTNLSQQINTGAGQIQNTVPQGYADPSVVPTIPESDYLWTGMNGTTWQAVSDGIYANATSPQDYVNDVNFYTQIHVRYHYDVKDWSVETPNRTWQTGQGSCIDIAVLDAAMLTRHGIDAHIVYGLAYGQYHHTTVQVTIGANQFMIDHRTVTQYQKLGDGLAPREYMLPDVTLL